jgi:hypothetical protein
MEIYAGMRYPTADALLQALDRVETVQMPAVLPARQPAPKQKIVPHRTQIHILLQNSGLPLLGISVVVSFLTDNIMFAWGLLILGLILMLFSRRT